MLIHLPDVLLHVQDVDMCMGMRIASIYSAPYVVASLPTWQLNCSSSMCTPDYTVGNVLTKFHQTAIEH